MRSLAKHLGVAPGAAYYYVANKEELLQLVGQVIVDATPLPKQGSWQEQLRSLIKGTVATFSAFPGSDVLAGSPGPWRRAYGRPHQYLHDLLVRAGFGDDEAEQAVFTVRVFISGALRTAELCRRAGGTEPLAESPELDGAIDTLVAGLTAALKPD